MAKMDEKQKKVLDLKTKITNLESELEAAKRALFDLSKEGGADTDQASPYPLNKDGKVIEGTFNGENMVGPEGKIFPVPANYASKSKLVEGDRLKLTIGTDGTFLFKQIGPVERRHIIGELKFQNNAYHVEAEGKNYNVLYASVTYHKAKPGDKVTIVVPATIDSNWSVLESIIHDLSPEDKAAAEKILEEKVTEEMKQPATTEPVSVDNMMPSNVHLAPDYSITEKQVTAQDSSDAFGLNDLEIKGATGDKAPEAVDPGMAASPAIPTISNTSTTEAKPEPISELEI